MSFEVHDELKLNGNKLTGLPTPTTAETTAAANVQFVLDNAGGAPTATNVSFTPDADTFPEGTDNVDVALKHLFTSANSGKQDVADSIGYDVTTTPYSGTFATLAEHIDAAKADLTAFLPKAEKMLNGTEKLDDLTELAKNVRVFKSTVKLRKAAGSTTEIQLKPDFPTMEKLVCTPFVRVNDEAQTDLIADFNNGEKSSFEDNDYIEFVGSTAKLKNNYEYNYTSLGSGISEVTIDASQFEEFKEITIGSNVTLVARPKPQVLIAKNNIPLDTVVDIFKITRTTAPSNFSFQWWVVSFDSGTRWWGNFTSSDINGWQEIDITDPADFIDRATWRSDIGIDVVHALRYAAGNNPNTIKFAYLLQDASYTQKNIIDKLELFVVMNGTFVPYSHSNPNATTNTFNYNASTGTVTVNHSFDDAYLINYIDYPDYP